MTQKSPEEIQGFFYGAMETLRLDAARLLEQLFGERFRL